jgi:uncharacterized protein (DUF934 family)
MAQLIKGRALAVNDWQIADNTDEAASSPRPPQQRLILPLAQFLKAMAAGDPAATRAVLLKPVDQELDALQPYLAGLPLIAIEFPSTGDGRGFTLGRMLRERHGYQGELRAVGMVRVDQIYFLARCGFDAFDLAEGEDPELAIAQLHRFSVAYQSEATGSLIHPRHRYGG